MAGSVTAMWPGRRLRRKDEAYVKRLVADTVTKFGKLDVFVHNAGFAIFGSFEKISAEDWHKIMGSLGQCLSMRR